MRRVLQIGILTLMLSSFSCKAQETVDYGVKMGYSLSSFKSDDDGIDITYKSGFVFGGYSKIPLGHGIYFQPELLISQKGYRDTEGPIAITDIFFKFDTPFVYIVKRERTNRLTYLSVPLNFAFSITKQFGVLVGGEPSVLINEFRTDRYSGMKNYTETFSSLEHNSFDLGLILGVSFQQNKFNLDLRYVHGVLDTRESSTFSYTNSSLQIALGYRVFKKKLHY